MNLKRLLTIPLAILLSLGNMVTFAACSDDNPDDNNNPPVLDNNGNNGNNNGGGEVTPPPTFNISQDWLTHIDGKLADIPEGKSFVFITDTHWESNNKGSTELLKYVNYKLGGNLKIVCGGDVFGSENTRAKAVESLNEYYTDELYSAFGSNALFVRGNHDSNDLGPDGEQILDTEMFENTVAKIEDAVIDLENAQAFGESVKNYFTQNPKDGLDATFASQQAEAFMKMHYYVDDEDTKIRHIVMDSAGKTWTQRNLCSGHMYNNILVTQVQWLADVLESTPLDYDVALSCHSIGDEGSAQYANLYASVWQNIYQLLTMFKYQQSGKTKYLWFGGSSPVLLSHYNVKAEGYPIEVDFTNRKGSTSNVILLGGHWHGDGAWYVGKNGDNVWGVEIADCSNLSKASTYANPILTIKTACDARATQISGDNMTHTGITSQRFDIITFADGEVVCTRIGTGENRYFNY